MKVREHAFENMQCFTELDDRLKEIFSDEVYEEVFEDLVNNIFEFAKEALARDFNLVVSDEKMKNGKFVSDVMSDCLFGYANYDDYIEVYKEYKKLKKRG